MDEQEEALGELIPLALIRAHYYERMFKQDRGDFETAAMYGAWDAVRRYDPTKGASLRTYARQRIDGTIIDWFREEASKNGGSRHERCRTNVRCVDFNDLSRDIDGYMSEGALIESLPQSRTRESGYDFVINHDLIKHLRTRMDEKDWDIMIRCVCNEEYQWKVAEDYGVTESRICQILGRAIARARKIIAEMEDESLISEAEKEQMWLRRTHEEGLGA
jgi:RNA polymerase sigma factor (sigma-70 family)